MESPPERFVIFLSDRGNVCVWMWRSKCRDKLAYRKFHFSAILICLINSIRGANWKFRVHLLCQTAVIGGTGWLLLAEDPAVGRKPASPHQVMQLISKWLFFTRSNLNSKIYNSLSSHGVIYNGLNYFHHRKVGFFLRTKWLRGGLGNMEWRWFCMV